MRIKNTSVSMASVVFAALLSILVFAFATAIWLGSEDRAVVEEITSAREIASIAGMARLAILSSDPKSRNLLLDEMDDFGGVSVALLNKDEASAVKGVLLPPRMSAEIKSKLGEDILLMGTQEGRGVIVGFPLGEETLVVTIQHMKRDLPDIKPAWFAMIVTVAALLSLFVAKSVSKPISRLSSKMNDFARGVRGDFGTSGAFLEEVSSLDKSFCEMSKMIAENEKERDLVLAGISHDMRTPLARMSLIAEFSDEETRTSLMEEIQGMDTMLTGFMEFVKTGEFSANSDFDLGDLLEESMIAASPPGKSVDMESLLRQRMCFGPRLEMKRMFSNLVSNAWKYGREKVWIKLDSSGNDFVIDVMDDGPGFGKNPERLLKPFERGEAARTGADGSGLGLSVVDRTSRKLSGRVSFPDDGKSGWVRITLPRTQQVVRS